MTTTHRWNSPIYGYINIPSQPPIASSKTLQWSTDGQLLIVTDSVIYIVTAETGTNLDRDRKSMSKEVPLEWSKTSAPLIGTNLHWPEITTEWAALCLGAMDYKWVAATWSPTNSSKEGSCLLAALTSNLEVAIWSPGQNPYRGEWTNIQTLTSHLRSTMGAVTSANLNALLLSLHCQVQSIAWSSQPEAAGIPHGSASLLALGNRAGHVMFLRLQNRQLELFHTLKVANRWVTHLTWAPWEISTNDQWLSSRSYLACGTPDGSILLISVEQAWDRSSGSLLTASIEINSETPCEKDRGGITLLEWVSVQSGPPILVHCKPGLILLWSAETSSRPWFGKRRFQLELQVSSKASNHYTQAAGISYIAEEDTLVISLLDGSYHTVYCVCEDPSLVSPVAQPSHSSSGLTKAARRAFLTAEERQIIKPKDGSEPPKLYENHYAKTFGMHGFDGCGVFMWIHHKILAETLEFFPDSKIRCMLIVAPLLRIADADINITQRLQAKLERPGYLLHHSPIETLRGELVHLRRGPVIDHHQDKLLDLLKWEPEDRMDVDPPEPIPLTYPQLDGAPPNLQCMVDRALVQVLWDDPGLHAARLRLFLARFCSEVSHKHDQAFIDVAQDLERKILIVCLRQRLEYLLALPKDTVLASGSSFALRTLKQTRLLQFSEEKSIRTLAGRLIVKLWTNPDNVPQEDPELCPVCGAEIPFTDLKLGTCTEGHAWSRCSVTSYILSTPYVRTCMACSEKMLLLPSHVDFTSVTGSKVWPAAFRNEWVARSFVGACLFCLSCGNRCVRIL